MFDLRDDRRVLVAQRAQKAATETFTLSLRTRVRRVVARDPIDAPRANPWQPQFGPGNVISRIDFVNTRHTWEIAIHEDGRVRRVAPRAMVTAGPAWSVAAQPLAYEIHYPIPESPRMVVLRLPDGRDVGVSTGSNPRWSPNGATLAFDSPATESIIADAGGRVIRRFPAVGFNWSRDGTKSAFVASAGPYPAGGFTHLYVAGPDGTGATPIAPAAQSYYAAPAWSPDGHRLAFVRKDDPGVWVIRADGVGLRKVAAL